MIRQYVRTEFRNVCHTGNSVGLGHRRTAVRGSQGDLSHFGQVAPSSDQRSRFGVNHLVQVFESGFEFFSTNTIITDDHFLSFRQQGFCTQFRSIFRNSSGYRVVTNQSANVNRASIVIVFQFVPAFADGAIHKAFQHAVVTIALIIGPQSLEAGTVRVARRTAVLPKECGPTRRIVAIGDLFEGVEIRRICKVAGSNAIVVSSRTGYRIVTTKCCYLSIGESATGFGIEVLSRLVAAGRTNVEQSS